LDLVVTPPRHMDTKDPLGEESQVASQPARTTVTTTATANSTANEFVIEGLTLYDMHRTLREPTIDESSITMPIRILNRDLTCPICLNIIQNTLTVMECLHRFCNACISKSLRTGKKECPTCRLPVLSRRNMRPDPNFDTLIKNLYPNLDEYEAKEEEVIQQINNEYVAKVMSNAVDEGMKRQQKAKRDRSRDSSSSSHSKEKNQNKPKPKASDESSRSRKKKQKTTSNTTGAVVHVPPPVEEVGLAVAPHPKEKGMGRLERPFLRIPSSAYVRHIAKFLASKTGRDASQIRLVLGRQVRDVVAFVKGSGGNDFETPERPLEEDVPLSALTRLWNRRDDVLLLYYEQLPNDLKIEKAE